MIYNVVLFSKTANKAVSILKSLDGRPLRFTDSKYAEREAQDKNNFYSDSLSYDLKFIVVEENKNICPCETKKCLSYL